MSALTIWKFNSPTGADVAEETVLNLQKQGLIEVEDAATVSWPSTKKRPKTRQLNRLAGLGALDGAFWGLLFGLIFFVPFLGAAVGAAAGGGGGGGGGRGGRRDRRVDGRHRHRRRPDQKGARRDRAGYVSALPDVE